MLVFQMREGTDRLLHGPGMRVNLDPVLRRKIRRAFQVVPPWLTLTRRFAVVFLKTLNLNPVRHNSNIVEGELVLPLIEMRHARSTRYQNGMTENKPKKPLFKP